MLKWKLKEIFKEQIMKRKFERGSMIKISERYALSVVEFDFEDELPEMTYREYVVWYLNSWIDGGVRILKGVCK